MALGSHSLRHSAIVGIVALVFAGLIGAGSTVLLDVPMAGATSTNSIADSYWLVGADGGVFAFGDAGFYGSLGDSRLNAPIVGMAAAPADDGYWLVAADGGVFAFGDAGFYGSLGGTRLDAPIVGMAATPNGQGYWLVAADGGVFAFGDAGFYGSLGGTHLDAPIVGMAATTDGGGYYLAGADGGVFTFGDAGFYGSFAGGTFGTAKAIGISLPFGAPPVPPGYFLVASNGQTASVDPAPPQPNSYLSPPSPMSGPTVGFSATLVVTPMGEVLTGSGGNQLPGLLGQPLAGPIVGIFSFLA